MSRFSASRVAANSKSVRPDFSVTVEWAGPPPYSAGFTSKAPPVTRRPPTRSRYSPASSAWCGRATGSAPASASAAK